MTLKYVDDGYGNMDCGENAYLMDYHQMRLEGIEMSGNLVALAEVKEIFVKRRERNESV